MTNVAYRSSSFAANTAGSDAGSTVVTKPSGTASGDLLLAICCGFQGGTSITPPSGFTRLDGPTDVSTGLRCDIYYKNAGGSEPSTYTFAWSPGVGAISTVMIAISNPDAAWLDEFSYNIGTATSLNPVSLSLASTASNGGLAIAGLCSWRTSGTNSSTGPAGWTERQDFVRQGTTANYRGQAIYTKDALVTGGAGVSWSATYANAPSGTYDWIIFIPDRVQTTSGSSTLGGTTSSGTGTATSNPSGSGTSTLTGVTDAGTGEQYITGSGGSHLSTGATSDGQADMEPKGSGTSTLGGVTSDGEMAVAGTKLEVKIDGVWTDITVKLRHEQGVTITRGKSSSGSQTVTTTCTFTLDNRQHEFNPFNANGAYYGYLNRNTEIRMTKQEVGVRFWGEIASYTFNTDQSGNDLSVDVQCAGMLRRLEQGEGEEASAMRRELVAKISNDPSNAPQDYWPCEEPAGSSRFANYGATSIIGAPITVSSIDGETSTQFASYSDVPGSSAIPQVGQSKWSSHRMGGNPGDGMTFSFLLASPGGMTPVADDLPFFMIDDKSIDSAYQSLHINYIDTNTFEVVYRNAGGTTFSEIGTFRIVGRKGAMFYLSMYADSTQLYAQDVESNEVTLVADLAAGPLAGSTLGWGSWAITVNPYSFTLNEASSAYIGHIARWNIYDVSGTGDDLPTIASMNGYLGEEAHTRFERLCTEEGVNSAIEGTSSKRMGYQKTGKFVDLLRQCEATDDGIMFELRDDFGLGYRCLSTLYNQDPALELDYDGNHLLNEFQPTYDDQDVTNDVTVSRDGGSSARYEITSGRMSTSESPTGIGRYDTSETLSLFSDDDCYPQAGWRAFKGSIDEIRISKLSTGLEVPAVDADEDLRTQILTIDLGDRLTVANPPAWMGTFTDEVDQILDGYTERWDPTEHRWTYNTSPAKPYSVAKVGDGSGTGALLASATGSVDSPATSSATTFNIRTSQGDERFGGQWKTGAVDFDIEVNGERMTVTNVAYIDGPSGMSHRTRYTLTVTRAVNGVSKALSTLDSVKLWNRPRVAL